MKQISCFGLSGDEQSPGVVGEDESESGRRVQRLWRRGLWAESVCGAVEVQER